MLGLLAYLDSPIGWVSLALIVLCIVHAVRSGNAFPWLYVIIFLPALGSLIYQSVRRTDERIMPPKERDPLSPDDVQVSVLRTLMSRR